MGSLKEQLEGQAEDATNGEAAFADLIRDDWLDMVSAFFFPHLTKMLTDDTVRQWVEQMRQELSEVGQEVK